MEKQIIYSGRVQGVGFRYSVKRLAEGYEVAGWVRNLPDGRVELRIRGEDEEVRNFLDAVAAGELRGFIREQQEGSVGPDEGCTGFAIHH